jgi:hypothetical protein
LIFDFSLPIFPKTETNRFRSEILNSFQISKADRIDQIQIQMHFLQLIQVQGLIKQEIERERREYLDRDHAECRREFDLAFQERRQPNRLPLQELPWPRSGH